jgi:hypothetical protein
LPAEFGGLTALESLNLYGNPNLGELPDSVESLRKENGGICEIYT